DDFQVRDQVRQRVRVARAFRRAAAAAALVEQYRVESFGVEQPTMIGLATRAWAAMQVDGADPALAADALDVELVAVADRELFRCQGRERIGARSSHIHVRRHVECPGYGSRIMFRRISTSRQSRLDPSKMTPQRTF